MIPQSDQKQDLAIFDECNHLLQLKKRSLEFGHCNVCIQ